MNNDNADAYDVDWGESPHDGKPSMNDCMRTYAGFVVTCEACSSGRVLLTQTLVSSGEGAPSCWLDLTCVSCGASYRATLP